MAQEPKTVAGTRRWILICGGVACIAAVTLSVARWAAARRAEGEAKGLADLARRSAGLATTQEDARRWLEANDCTVVIWNPHDPREWVGAHYVNGQPAGLVVDGGRKLSSSSLFSKEMWVRLSFVFDLQDRFQRVEQQTVDFAFVEPDPRTR